MIKPLRYRLGVEIVGDLVRAVLIESTSGGVRIIDFGERGYSGRGGASEDRFLKLLGAVAGMVPDGSESVAASLVLPADRVVESTVRIPIELKMPAGEWEEWDLSNRLPVTPEGYWYESRYDRDSVCGRFQMRRVIATRRDFVGRILKAAADLQLFVDEIYFPQFVLGPILRDHSGVDSATRLECVYLADRLSYFLRTRAGVVSDMSILSSPPDADTRRFVETVGTLLSWHGGEPKSDARRIIIDGGGSGEAAFELASKLGFSRFNPRAISPLLDGTIDKPELFLLPLGALGVI